MRRTLITLVLLGGAACGVVPSSVEASWVLAPGTKIRPVDASVEIWVLDPHCEHDLSADDVDIDVAESDTSVVISATVPDHSGASCKLRANPVRIVVDLDDPLGERELLVGGSDGPTVPVVELRAGMPIPDDE